VVERRILGLLLAGLVVVGSVAAAERDQESRNTRVLDDRFSLRLVGGLVYFNTDVAAGRSLGALIDLEDVLGFDEQISTIGIEGFWRFSKNRKHALRLRYGNFDRDASTSVEGRVPIFDLEFFGEVASSFVNQVGSIEYQYSFINQDRTEAGITAGLGIYRYKLELEGQIVVADPSEERAEFRKESVGVVAPVPAFGFYINQALRRNVILEIRTSFVDLEIGEHNGRIFTTFGSMTWYFVRHWGVGVGITGSDVVYEKNSSKEKLKAEIRQTSLTVNLTAVF
jgi:hypothetical protein